MKCGAILFLLFVVVNTDSVEEKKEAAVANVLALDFTEEITTDQTKCFDHFGFSTAFVRIYDGKVDEVGIRNLKTIRNLGVELVVVPELEGKKSPYTQISEIEKSIADLGYRILYFWLQITSPLTWDKSVAKNTQFIQDFTKEAARRSIGVKYYTNFYDYKTITGNSKSLNDSGLWYWNVLGSGDGAETPSNFNDFRPFGPFRQPLAKQYCQGCNACGAIVNKNLFNSWSSKSGGNDTLSSVKYIGKKTSGL